MKFLLTLALTAALASPSLCAFDFQVKNIERVPVKATSETFHPVFSADGKSLIVTSEAYQGLGTVSLADGKYRRLTDRDGAGYRFAQNADGSQIVVRENDFITQKLSLYLIDVEQATEECIMPVVENTNTLVLNEGVVAFAEPVERKVVTRIDPRTPRTMAAKVAATPLLTEEDLKLVLYKDGQRIEVDPIMATTGEDVNYCWSSLSPDGQRMLFVARNDAYTCRLDGSDLVNLGPIHAPVWRDNNTVVGMNDADDGHFFTSSNIVAADIKSAEVIQLTPDSDEIKMYPAVSADGNRIAYHTTDGDIYIINLEPVTK